jgi:hypothetical protein
MLCCRRLQLGEASGLRVVVPRRVDWHAGQVVGRQQAAEAPFKASDAQAAVEASHAGRRPEFVVDQVPLIEGAAAAVDAVDGHRCALVRDGFGIRPRAREQRWEQRCWIRPNCGGRNRTVWAARAGCPRTVSNGPGPGGGSGGIRTHGDPEATTAFEAVPFVRSGTLPSGDVSRAATPSWNLSDDHPG